MNQTPLLNDCSLKLKSLITVVLDYLDNVNEILKEIEAKSQNSKQVYTKEDGEKFTEADWVLQKYFEDLFKLHFPSITIIGEEDTAFAITTTINYSKYLEKTTKTPDERLDPFSIEEVLDQKDLTVYIDPIDATNQYIKGNYAPVTVLIGICINNQPFIGFIHYPLIQEPLTYFNIPSKGIFFYKSQSTQIAQVNQPEKSGDEWTFNISLVNHSKEKLQFISQFQNAKILQDKGLGNKALLSILNDTTYISINKGLGLWDICAADCIGHELGGGYFHFDLTPITYTPKRNWYDETMFFCSNKLRKDKIQSIIHL